jgi:hypothetical protein
VVLLVADDEVSEGANANAVVVIYPQSVPSKIGEVLEDVFFERKVDVAETIR